MILLSHHGLPAATTAELLGGDPGHGAPLDPRYNVWVPESRSWVLSCGFVDEAIGPR